MNPRIPPFERAPSTKDVLVDPTPDERGNLLAMALLQGGRAVSLTLNAN